MPASRGIVGPINRLTAELRSLGVPVIWVLHANSRIVYFCNLDIAHRDRTAGWACKTRTQKCRRKLSL